MAKAVYKFILEDALSQTVNLYSGAVVLSCAMQQGKICLWVLVDPNAPYESRQVLSIGTGSTIDENRLNRFDFVGTVLDPMFREVWHIFVEQAPRVITPEAMAEANREYLSNPENLADVVDREQRQEIVKVLQASRLAIEKLNERDTELCKARAGIIELDRKLKEAEAEIIDLRSGRNTAEGQVRQLIGQRHNQDREIQSLRDQVVELEAERLSLKSQVGPSLNSLREEVKRLESDNQKLKSDLEACLLDRAGK